MTIKGLKRWAPWLALVLIFALLTSALAWWQLSRRDQRVAAIELVMENYDAPLVNLEQISWRLADDGTKLDEWRMARVSGQYLTDLTTLARNRPLAGQPGFLQLVPMKLADGRILIVERGWLPTGSLQDSPDTNPLPQSGAVDIVVRLRPSESDLGRQPVAGQIASIDLKALATRFQDSGPVVTDYYGRLVSEAPAAEQYALAMPKPSLNEGNHLSYAFQWIIFGLMAFIAFGWAWNQERKLRLIAAGKAAPKAKKNTQALRDAAAEDI